MFVSKVNKIKFVYYFLNFQSLGFTDITKMLIENGALVNAKGFENVTPLGVAAYSGKLFI